MNQIVQSNEERDAIVAAYKEAGLGGERYGVVCGLIDEETHERCMKRICPQGWAAALKFNAELNQEGKVKTRAGLYCLHRENYDGTEPADDIGTILNTHGLPWRQLRTLRKMRENKPSKKKGNKGNGKRTSERTGNDAASGRGTTSTGSGPASGHEGASGEVPNQGPTFGQYLDGKLADPSLAPSDGESGRARLFLARREKEAEERRTPLDGNPAS